MTAVAQLVLFLRQKILGSSGVMNGVAVGAGNIGLSMFGTSNIRFVEVTGMAGQAGLHDGFGAHQGEGAGNRVLTAARLDMRFGRAVAALATRALGRLRSGGDAFEMGVLIEIEPDIGMARPADVTAHISR